MNLTVGSSYSTHWPPDALQILTSMLNRKTLEVHLYGGGNALITVTAIRMKENGMTNHFYFDGCATIFGVAVELRSDNDCGSLTITKVLEPA